MIALEKLAYIWLLLYKRDNLFLGFTCGKTLQNKELPQGENAEFDFV